MKKRQYIAPAIAAVSCADELMLNTASISSVGGNAGIGLADSDAPVPSEADAKGHTGGLWNSDED